jgi:hypothetical protein
MAPIFWLTADINNSPYLQMKLTLWLINFSIFLLLGPSENWRAKLVSVSAYTEKQFICVCDVCECVYANLERAHSPGIDKCVSAASKSAKIGCR